MESGVRIENKSVVRRMIRIPPRGENGRVGGWWLLLEDIDTGSGEMTLGERIDDGSGINDSAARGVDEKRSRLHLRNFGGSDQPSRFLRERAMQARDESFAQQFCERIDTANPERFVHSVGEIGIVKNDVEPEGFGTQRGGGSDASAADDSKNATAEAMDRLALIDVPVTESATEAAVEKVRASREGERHRESGVGDFFGAVVGNVADGNAVFAGGVEINAVIADTGADDDFTLFEPLDARPREAEVVIDHDRIGVLDLTGEIGFGHRIEGRDLGVPVENSPLVIEWLVDEISDDDFG